MVVYADILIILNVIVDYFLLSITAKILKNGASVFRLISASVLGGVSSLIIFLPPIYPLLQMVANLAISALIAFTAFGFCTYKKFLKNIFCFFAVSFLYAGGMLAIFSIGNFGGMVINNSVVYINISPFFLILFSAMSYIVILVLRGIFKKKSAVAERCSINIFLEKRNIEVDAIVDTGNSIEDSFGTGEVIIIDGDIFEAVFSDLGQEKLRSRYRVLPCTTVSGGDLLEGYRCDKAQITYNNKVIELARPIVAMSKVAFGSDYSAIINPEILE